MGKFSGILIASDLDGTLVSDGKISKENSEAIRFFQKEGGLFTVATGRYLSHITENFSHDITPNTHVLTLNGNVVCNPENNTETILSQMDKNLAKTILNYSYEKFEENIQFVNICNYDESYKYEGSLTDKPCKCVFVMNTEESAILLRDTLKENYSHVISAERSWSVGVEIYSINGGKGNAIDYIRKNVHPEIQKVICVGDYENDISMLKYADVGVAVANGTDDAKNSADIVCPVSCHEHALSWIINNIYKEGLIK